MRYAQRTRSMRASEIRELLKLTQQPGIISFAGGLPDPKTFPVEELKATTNYVYTKYSDKALQYGTTEGYELLRELLAERCRKRGIKADKDNLITLAASQQGLDLMAKIFVDPRSTLYVEKPSYLGGIQAYRSYEAQTESFELDENGLRVELVEKALKEGGEPRFLYTIPDFHNPAGVEMSEERRSRIVTLTNSDDIPVLEDNPYSYVRYEGKPLQPIKTFGKRNNVVYLETFSKTLVPGLRIAFITGPYEIIGKLILAKQGTSLCTSPLIEYILYEFLARDLLDKHVEEIIPIYKEKRDIMMEALDDHMPEGVEWTKSKGGLFTFVKCPKGIDTKQMLPYAIDAGVAYVPGTAFFVDGSGNNTMRVNFSYPKPEDIKPGVKKLSGVIEKQLKRIEVSKVAD